MNKPRVSIVIPAYNSADTIVEALDSVAAQTVGDYEIIVVDDASTDNTVEVVQSRSKSFKVVEGDKHGAWGMEHGDRIGTSNIRLRQDATAGQVRLR
jgi:glycosyltransferase involved in cell wall biosynthesis